MSRNASRHRSQFIERDSGRSTPPVTAADGRRVLRTASARQFAAQQHTLMKMQEVHPPIQDSTVTTIDTLGSGPDEPLLAMPSEDDRSHEPTSQEYEMM